jgi:hypothetical protein
MKPLLILLLIFTTHIHAQQMISVIDTDTRDPVAYAAFSQNGDTIAYTSLQGIAVLPKVSGSILLTCKNYKPIELNADSIPSVIRMKCLIERLKEVVVVGDSTKIKNKKKFDLPDNVLLEYELNDIYNNQGLKLPITSLYKLIGYKPKSQRRRNRTKKILEAYDESNKKDKKEVK